MLGSVVQPNLAATVLAIRSKFQEKSTSFLLLPIIQGLKQAKSAHKIP
jgi:hypothetical protein